MAIACAAIYGVGWVRGHHSAELEFERFKGAAEALGKAAEDRAAFRIAKDKANKETVDANYKVTISNLRATADRLRRDRAGASFLPTATADTIRPDLACFDREAFNGAMARLDERGAGIALEGAEATVGLDAGRAWALRMTTELR